ncbi:hypothetical protein K469DRAFT_138678 [Zopfia rhizophila CBS 207.26]|uniref:Uncharacterized protein n=1 Tax=Zopfia rhizophila CBS 207.26 TaxID=1314779 RepID=A0A6A6E9E6_9PEZI|nr:hypothetical protein K469DRAFT_138678 [Zopfia rhizophila CBS 207.26]
MDVDSINQPNSPPTASDASPSEHKHTLQGCIDTRPHFGSPVLSKGQTHQRNITLKYHLFHKETLSYSYTLTLKIQEYTLRSTLSENVTMLLVTKHHTPAHSTAFKENMSIKPKKEGSGCIRKYAHRNRRRGSASTDEMRYRCNRCGKENESIQSGRRYDSRPLRNL